MKIYDCFMFFDEEMLLDLRLHVMNKYVDKFVITEANYMHNGKPKKLIFDINKYQKFKDKIIYVVVDQPPPDLFELIENESQKSRESKLILNGYKRDNYQREMAYSKLKYAGDNDWIIINDIDEIPNLENINFNEIKNKIVIFKQEMFFYKFNLIYPSKYWYGSKACKKVNFISPQWLRNVRHRKYPIWRIDTLLSKKKYNDMLIVNNGGWHFTNIKSPENIEKKLQNYTHHYEYEQSGLKLSDIKNMVSNKKIIYDHSIDQRGYKWKGEKTLKKVSLSKMPSYLSKNPKKYNDWLEG